MHRHAVRAHIAWDGQKHEWDDTSSSGESVDRDVAPLTCPITQKGEVARGPAPSAG